MSCKKNKIYFLYLCFTFDNKNPNNATDYEETLPSSTLFSGMYINLREQHMGTK